MPKKAGFSGPQIGQKLGRITGVPSNARWVTVLILAIFALIFSSVGLYRTFKGRDIANWESPKQEMVYAQTYTNQTVDVDGNIFDHCHFINTKLLYHGRGPVSFVQSDFAGITYVGSDNIAIRNFSAMDIALSKAPGTTRLNYWIEKDKNGNTVSVQ